MGFRYRKSIKLLPGVKLNISKSGISTSVGKRGATVNFSRRGTRATVGIPGSGISYSTMVNKKRRVNNPRQSRRQVADEAREVMMNRYGLTRREANRFVNEVKKHPRRYLGKSDEEIVARFKKRRMTSGQKIFLLSLLLLFLIWGLVKSISR